MQRIHRGRSVIHALHQPAALAVSNRIIERVYFRVVFARITPSNRNIWYALEPRILFLSVGGLKLTITVLAQLSSRTGVWA